MSEEVSPIFQQGLEHFGLEDRLGTFLQYREELLSWNSRFNLTAIKDPDEVLIRHFLDSLSLLDIYPQTEKIRLLDIGTGPGFPGLPLKIARPNWHITLMEATGKKVTFLNHIVTSLHLTDVDVIHGRVEDLAHEKSHRGQYDLVTARAVASLPVLLECSAPYCRQSGSIIFLKKGDLDEELRQGQQAANHVGAHLQQNYEVILPGLNDGRRLLVWQQQKLCPPRYPRPWAAMNRQPL